jgi:Zn-dependent protease with chaperone function
MSGRLPANLRAPGERFYGSLLIVLGTVIWAGFAITLAYLFQTNFAAFSLYAFYMTLFVLVTLITAAWFRAYIYGHYVLIDSSQLPLLHSMVVEGARKIGLSSTPRTFVYNSNGVVNAFARRLFGGRYVFLTSALIEVETDAQVNFVIGHELGHHAAGHLDMGKNLLKLPAHAIPFLGRAYSRRRELTSDRVGAYLSGDLQACRSALNMLACGCQRLNSAISCDAFEAQENLVPPFMGWLSLIPSRYPRTTQRVIAVSKFFAEGHLT